MSTDHTVRQGECINSLAERYGFFPDTLWDAAENKDLRDLREDPNILQPGDVVYIPDLTPREESGGTDDLHRFRRRGVPALFRAVFYRPPSPEEDSSDEDSADGADNADGGGFGTAPSVLGGEDQPDESVFEDVSEDEEAEQSEPIADAPYVLKLDGSFIEGRSDSQGLVEISIPLDASEATITFHKGADDEISFDLGLGKMDSIDTVIGARKRLCNMGFRCAPEGDELDGEMQDALRRFQAEHELETSGEIDEQTKGQLVDAHGS